MEISVGKLGTLRFDAAVYAYVGSAQGPGGLRSRIGRHLEKGKRRHWHIDYLREHAEIDRIWVIDGSRRLECAVAARLSALAAASPVPGFGASDCRCGSHLVACRGAPSRRRFERDLAKTLAGGCGIRVREWAPRG